MTGDKVLFLDRDGNINVDPIGSYITTPEAFHLIPGVADSLAKAKDAGFRLVIITNQACIGKGLLTHEGLSKIHDRMDALIRENGKFDPKVPIFESILYCPHLVSESCACRKPATKNLDLAIRQTKADLSRSYFVGDKLSDLKCGNAKGIKSIFVLTGHGELEKKNLAPGDAHAVVANLNEAIDLALREVQALP